MSPFVRYFLLVKENNLSSSASTLKALEALMRIEIVFKDYNEDALVITVYMMYTYADGPNGNTKDN